MFSGTGETLDIGTPVGFAGTIVGFQVGDTITVGGVTLGDDVFNDVSNTLTLQSQDGSYIGDLVFGGTIDYPDVVFSYSNIGDQYSEISLASVPEGVQTFLAIDDVMDAARSDPANVGKSEYQIADAAWTAIVDARGAPPTYGSQDRYIFLSSFDAQTLANVDHFMQGYVGATQNTLLFNPLTAIILGFAVDPVYNALKALFQSQGLEFWPTGTGAQSPASIDLWALTGAFSAMAVGNGTASAPGTSATKISSDGTFSFFVDGSGNTPASVTLGNSNTYTFQVMSGSGFQSILIPNGADPTVTYDNQLFSLLPGQTFNFIGAPSSFQISGLDAAFAGVTNPSVDLAFGQLGGDVFAVSAGQALCFLRGTYIATAKGPKPVQQLVVGDRVSTVLKGDQRIVWIGRGNVLAARGRRNAATPVIVRKGALADNVPNRDLRVTKGHSLYIDDVLIPVEFLVNHRSILWDDHAQEVTLYHIELETHDVLLANGAPAESYRDDGNRWLFQNANSGWGLPPQAPCAPVLTGGPIVDSVWRRLLNRAGPHLELPTTAEPDLHLLVDGQRLDGKAQAGDVYMFRLPGRPSSVRVISRAGVPNELGIARDPRLLGVAVRQIRLWRGARLRVLDAADEALIEGFQAFEPDNGFRWTDGNGALPAALFADVESACQIELLVGSTTQYPLFGEANQQAAA